MLDSVYAVKWDAKYYDTIRRLFKKIRLSSNLNIIDDFWNIAKKTYNDHKNTSLNDIPTLEAGYGEDLCTYQGLIRCIRLISGASTTRWTNMACGSSARTVTPFDTVLGTYITDVAFSTAGYIEANGASIAMAAVFPTSTATNTIQECLVADSSGATPTTVFTRNVFSGISHVQNTTFFTITELVELKAIV